MGYFNGILRTLNQKPNQEEEAIQTLSNRLQHATLANDRKSAVLGLKSFSRQFRETVVQYGLRGLLLTLGKDHENAPLTKAVLETLLILFLRGGSASDDETLGWISNQSRRQNGKYPSPLLEQIELDEFSNWIADEMISSDAHVKVLMDILQAHDGFQIRLFALQLLEAVVAARPDRTKECLINIPTAISTIVNVLSDPNDPIRNEAILLLMALVNNNFNIQKLVAFENTFERIFEIIDEEGGIRGSILVQDCMTLLTNLLKYNASNQKFFLETDCVPKLASLISEPIEDAFQNGLADDEGNPIPVPPIVWTEQRIQNMAIALDICKAFVDPDNELLTLNQDRLFSSGIFFSILRLVFSPVMENSVRKTALQATGDIIANNTQLQLQFSQIDVPYIDPSMPSQIQIYHRPIPAPLALLNWAMLTNSVHTFEIRLAAMRCLTCFVTGNDDAKMAFLTDQIKASKDTQYYEKISEQSETDGEQASGQTAEQPSNEELGERKTPYANIFNTLMVFSTDSKLNPYEVWFAAIALFYLVKDSPESKKLVQDMKIGNVEDGEEELSFIQAISGMLVAHIENSDPRIAVGFLNLLTLWLFEDFDAVNQFLEDLSILKALLAFLSNNSTESCEIVIGMCSILVGVCYEFTTKSSPLSREHVYELARKALGVDNYTLKVKQFKENPIFRNFDDDLESDFQKDSTGLPILFFIQEYVVLVKENFYRIRKALSRGPEFEPRAKISFEVFEELEIKNVELKEALADLKASAEKSEAKLNLQIELSQVELQESSDLLEKCRSELDELRDSEKTLSDKIEQLLKELKETQAQRDDFASKAEHYAGEFKKAQKKNVADEESLRQLTQKFTDSQAAKQKAEDGINKMSRELFQLTKQKKDADNKIEAFDKKISDLTAQHEKNLSDFKNRLDESLSINEQLKAKIQILESQSSTGAAMPDEKLLARMREFQTKISELEEDNGNLMEKLRSAATVVLNLKNEKLSLSESNRALQDELMKAYEELESVSNLLDEVRVLEDGVSKDEPSVHKSMDDSEHNEMRSLKEENEELSKQLSEALRELRQFKDEEANMIKKLAHDENKEKEYAEKSTETANGTRSEEVSSLTSKLETLKANYSLLEEELENLKLEAHKGGSEELETGVQIADLNRQLSEKDELLHQAKKRIENLERNIEVLSESAESSLSSFKNSQASLKLRIDELEEEKQKLSDEVNALRQTLEEEKSRYLDQIDDLEAANMDLELDMTNLEKSRDELSAKLTKEQHDSTVHIDQLTDTLELLQQKLLDTEADRDTLISDYYELEKLSNIIGSELQAKEAVLQAMTNKGADLAAKDKIVVEIKERLASTIAELGESAQKLRVLTRESTELEKNYTAALLSLESSKEKMTQMQEDISEKAAELEQARSERRKLASLQSDLVDANRINEESQLRIQALEEKAEVLQKELQIATESISEQKKMSLTASQAAISEYTEKTVKLEKALIENQDLHRAEIFKIDEDSQSKVKALQVELEQLKTILQREQASESDAKVLQGQMEDELKKLEQVLSESHEKYEKLDRELRDTAALLRSESEKLKAELTNLQSEKAEYEETLSQLSIARNTIETKTNEAKAMSEALEVAQSEKDILVGELKEQKEALELSKLHNSKSTQDQEKIVQLQEKMADLETSTTELKSLLESKDQTVNELQTELAAKMKAIEELQSLSKEQNVEKHAESNGNKDESEQLSENRADEKTALENKILELETNSERLTESHRRQQEEMQKRLEDLEGALSEASLDKNDTENAILQLRDEIVKANAERVTAEASCGKREAEVQEMKALLDEAQESQRKLEHDNEILEKSLQEARDASEPADLSKDVRDEDELLDVLALCEEQQRRIARYKRRMKAFDIPVSSDEED